MIKKSTSQPVARLCGRKTFMLVVTAIPAALEA